MLRFRFSDMREGDATDFYGQAYRNRCARLAQALQRRNHPLSGTVETMPPLRVNRPGRADSVEQPIASGPRCAPAGAEKEGPH